MYKYLIVLILCVAAKFSFAQNIEGRVYEEKTHNGLSSITVTNTRSGQQTQTLKYGAFVIGARVNDMLVFTGVGFKPDTLLLTDLRFKEVYLTPVSTQLAEVTIKGQAQANSKATIIPKDVDFHNQTMQYQMNQNGSYKGGVNLRVWSSKKGERDRKKEKEMLENDKVSKEIAQAFSEENLQKYIPLKGQELSGFIVRYSPNVDTYTSAEFNLANYLNKCYKEFMQLPLSERIKTDIFNQ
ncbi:hypothetical protein [Mucilaginibacter sp. KACC 22063]|uniref:hypothetical protein n=1 Tax=Mucilaginibacter sp. KACC 22063 TaxID=3025666 RepID=UPI002365B414|nr:hypothetical protein [Mucilaginibacter sp. KACC 22063]WDF54595.1 hypothetical protein PQ461_16810 [Mucilaginibacter sp. KACC 22063]